MTDSPAVDQYAVNKLAIDVCLGLREAPWSVRRHSEPRGRQISWLWSCMMPGCVTGGGGVNEVDAHAHAAEHYIRNHQVHSVN
jgi:hypothetical protein